MRNTIQKYRVDLVLLQEVVGKHEKHTPTTSQFEFLADGVWPHFAYGKNAVYDEGHHGNAILSLYPIVEWKNLDFQTKKE